VEEWLVKGEINKIDFGVLTWKSSEPLEIKVYFSVYEAMLCY
jgi:hypothetical protein